MSPAFIMLNVIQWQYSISHICSLRCCLPAGYTPTSGVTCLPVSTGAVPTWVNSQPISTPGLTHTPLTPISHGVPQSDSCHQKLNIPLVQHNTLLPVQSQQGMILSHMSDPIPPALVQKIQAGGFVSR